MSTPSFVTSSANFTDVRLYTEFDPYFYTVDNRPLQDLRQNTASTGDASDAGRSAAAIGAISEAAYNAGAHTFVNKVLGLGATNPTTGVVTIAPGVLLSKQAINAGDAREILKKAALPYTQNVSTPHPATLGKEVKHLIQVRHHDYDVGTSFPYYQAANAFSASSMVNGWLEVSVVTGNEADTGASVAPTATAGWTPLWLVLAVSGGTTVTITTPSGAVPRVASLVEDAPSDSNKYFRSGAAWSALTTAARTDSSVSFATTEFVKKNGFAFGRYRAISAAATLVADDIGAVVATTGATTFTATLPLWSSTVDVGTNVTVIARGTGAITIAAQGSDTLVNLNSTAVVPVLNAGDTVVLTKSPTAGEWIVTGGTLLSRYANSFAGTQVANGYQRLPNGTILQWATTASVGAGATTSVTFPLLFPTACLFAIANTTATAGSATPSNIVASTTPTASAVSVFNLGTVAGVAKVFAIGY